MVPYGHLNWSGSHSISIEQLVTEHGLTALFVLMAMNGFVSAPASEAVLAIGGILAATTSLSLPETLLTAILGNMLGTTLLFHAGVVIGNKGSEKVYEEVIGIPIVGRLFKRFVPNPEAFEVVLGDLSRNAFIVLCIGRCIPVIRSVISLPAGVARVGYGKFLVASSLGVTAWAVLWQVMGYALQSKWRQLGFPLTVGLVAAVPLVMWYAKNRLARLIHNHVKSKSAFNDA